MTENIMRKLNHWELHEGNSEAQTWPNFDYIVNLAPLEAKWTKSCRVIDYLRPHNGASLPCNHGLYSISCDTCFFIKFAWWTWLVGWCFSITVSQWPVMKWLKSWKNWCLSQRFSCNENLIHTRKVLFRGYSLLNRTAQYSHSASSSFGVVLSKKEPCKFRKRQKDCTSR